MSIRRSKNSTYKSKNLNRRNTKNETMAKRILMLMTMNSMDKTKSNK